MILLAISEPSVGLSLSIHRWKALPQQNMNIQIYFGNTLLSLNRRGMKHTHFCPKGPAICKISQQVILKCVNSKRKKFSHYFISKESYVSFKSYTRLMIS